MVEYYLWIKALHVIAVIAWMAGLLYLPRLYVYHCQAAVGSEKSEVFKVMERRLFRAIMNPAMIVVWITGPAYGLDWGFLDRPLVSGKSVFYHCLDSRPPCVWPVAERFRK